MYYLFYKVRSQEIHLIKFILESYEHMMLVSTVDEELPKIQITIAKDFLDDCKKIIDNLQKDLFMVQINDPPNVSQGNY